MKIKVKVFLSLILDGEEYRVPADGDVSEELGDALQEIIHDIDGIKVKSIKIIQEDKDE